MKLRVILIALATCLLLTETSNAQRGRGGPGGGFGGPGIGGPGPGFGGPGFGGPGIGPGGYYGGWGSPGYGGVGYRNFYGSGGYYYGPTYYNSDRTYIAPAYHAVNAPGGMQITEIADDSAAKKAALRAGDIITSVGASRIESFEDLQKALANANGEVEVAYLNGATMKTEKTKVSPRNGKIGVTVVFSYLP
jgi:membrane-associated protease RseP (regulator of RpoE activity)